MKLLTKKQEDEIKNLKKQNEFLLKGWRAMNICLDYQKAIVAILETLNINEIEIDNSLLAFNDREIMTTQTINHTTIIKIKGRQQNG